MEPDRAWSIEALMAETRADIRHLQHDVAELRSEFRQDIGRLDGRIDQIFLVQLATLAATVGSLVTALLAALA